MKAFAFIRTIFFGTLFISLWTWWVPRWMGWPMHVVHPEAWAVFELYGQNTGQQLSIEVFLIGAGPEPKRLEAQITTPPREADTYLVRARVPLTDLPPGDYQVRATVDVAAQPAVTIAATLRKVK